MKKKKKSAREILAERRAKQLEYYHRHKDDPEYKAKRKAADAARWERIRKQKEAENQSK